MPTLAQDWAAYEPEIAAFVGKVDSVLKYVTTNKTIEGLANHVPQGQHILAALGLAYSGVEDVIKFVPYVGEVISIYEAYKDLGGRPMDASDIAEMWADKSGDFPEYQG